MQTSVRLRARQPSPWCRSARRFAIEERHCGPRFRAGRPTCGGKVHPRHAWRLSRLISRRKVDLVHCDWSRDLFTLVPATALHRRRNTAVLHKHVGVLAGKRLWVHYALYRRVDHVIAIAKASS
ncbi:MAG: hypothetical protein IPH86_11935 [bacterium]|nr:hypothetical protein [bacterium]